MRYAAKRLSNWDFITYIHCTADLWLFIHFYYLQIMRTFNRSFYCFLIDIQTSFSRLWCHEFKNDSSNHIPNYTKQSKCCKIKITSWKHTTFLQNGSPHSVWIFLYRMYLIRGTFLRYKTNIFVSLLITRRRVFLWSKFSETWNENLAQNNVQNLVQNKLISKLK